MRHSYLRVTLRLIFFISFLLCGLLYAQDQTSISGKVVDSKGVPIPGAGVTVADASGKVMEDLTELDGTFKLEGLPSGTYKLTVEIVGFLKNVNEAVDSSSDSSRNLAIRLESLPRPHSPSAPKQASLQKQQEQEPSLEIPTFQAAQVTDLPGITQFEQDLTQPNGSAASITARQDSILFVSGNSANLDSGDFSGDPGFRNQMMDAARNMGFMIQEFNPGGEGGRGGPEGGGASFAGVGGGFGGGPGGGPGGFGGGPGGGPGGGMGFVGMGGRGGRGANFRQPAVQGTLSENYSNSALNARSYSLTGKTLDKPVQIQNSFSLTLGGVLPFFKRETTTSNAQRNRAQSGRGRIGGQPGWSFSYSGSRNRSAQDILTTVPTDLERAGDFSQSYVQAQTVDPITGQRTVVLQPVRLYRDPNNPTSQFTKISSIDPIAAGLLKFIPRPNIPCAPNQPCVNNYALERSTPTSSDQIQASINGLRIGSRDSFAVNYSRVRGKSLNPALFQGLDTDRSNTGQNVGISGNHTFKTRMTSNWRVSLNRTRIESSNAFAYKTNVEGDLGITGVSQDPINWGPPTIGFTNYGSLSLAAPALNTNQTLSVSGGLNKMGTRHSIRTGADASWAQRNSQSDSNGRGSYNFTGYATILLAANGSQVSGTGNDFADFLLGLPYSTSRRYVDATVNPHGNGIYLRNRTLNLYVMDNWRISSRITLNYGVRYEYQGPSFEKYNRLVTLDAGPGFTTLAQVFPDQRGPLSGLYFSRSLITADRNNIAPRVGIAWRPTARSPFVFRAGYGIGYNPGSGIVNQLVNQAPFAINQNLSSDRANPLTLAVGFPENPALTITNTYAVDPLYHAAYAQQWNLDVQTQIARLYVLSVSYNGSKGTGLDITRAPNRSSSASNFRYQTNGGSSIYHGVNAQFSRRFSRGFNVTTSYTLSKSIDDTPGGVAQNDADLAAERALSSQDQRHNFQVTYAYELPIGQNRQFFAGSSPKLLNFIAGWTFNGNLTLASGAPLTARYASSSGSGSAAALYNSLRPDATGLDVSIPKYERTLLRFFNTAAFAIPTGAYGNAGRNTITGPGSFMMNLSVRKSIRLDENNRRVDFSWQIQNLLNHPNWGGVSTTVNALNFGQVTSMRAMRSMNMSLRINF